MRKKNNSDPTSTSKEVLFDLSLCIRFVLVSISNHVCSKLQRSYLQQRSPKFTNWNAGTSTLTINLLLSISSLHDYKICYNVPFNMFRNFTYSRSNLWLYHTINNTTTVIHSGGVLLLHLSGWSPVE
jgi:hypothetical protein